MTQKVKVDKNLSATGSKKKEKGNRLRDTKFGLTVFLENKTRNLAITGVLIAITVILTRLLAIQTNILRVSLEFVPIVVAATLFGPVIGGLTAGLADIVGMLVFPPGPYFPGFTISATIYGVIYGLFLYRRKIKIGNTMLAVLANIIIVDFILVSIWIHILYQVPYSALVVTRLIKCAVMYPVQVLTIYYGVNAIKKNVRI